MATRVQAAGLDIDQPTIDSVSDDLVTGRTRLDRLRNLLAADPLIGLARSFPPTQTDVLGADSLATAAGHLFDAADQGLALAQHYVDIKTAPADQDTTTLSRLVEFIATSRDRALVVQASIARARVALATVPDGPGSSLGTVRDAIGQRIETYGPLLDAYVDISERLPTVLGWEGPRRYLVLTQNPAELRPTGGYTGSYGIIGFDRGRVTERTFRDVFLLDFPWDFPYIAPPRELTDYLLGPNQPWQFADANWSPDFPTSAQDALRLYANESGDDAAGRRPRHHDLHDRRIPRADRSDRGPGVRRDDRVGRDHAQGPRAHARRATGRESQGFPLRLRGPTVRQPPRAAAGTIGRGRRPGQHIPEPAPAAGLVPRSCRPGARRPQRLRWRR